MRMKSLQLVKPFIKVCWLSVGDL